MTSNQANDDWKATPDQLQAIYDLDRAIRLRDARKQGTTAGPISYIAGLVLGSAIGTSSAMLPVLDTFVAPQTMLYDLLSLVAIAGLIAIFFLCVAGAVLLFSSRFASFKAFALSAAVASSIPWILHFA